MSLDSIKDAAGKGFHDIAETALSQNPALEGLRIVIEDYMEEAASKRLPSQSSNLDSSSSPGPLEAGNTPTEDTPADYLPVVLLVGGDESIETVVQLVMHDLPHKLIWARDVEALTEKLKDNKPELILGEVTSSSPQGFHLIQCVKTLPETCNTPVVLLNRESALDCLYATYSAINRGGKAQQSPDVGKPS
ncbi:MAG TPA: hypothetical protein VJX67_23115 [Blastocatellia bacterium]|nr:hypothetical protein [Blastocatellia bacterium]